jgi:hypothetical protein
MSPNQNPPDAEEVFEAFVRELASGTQPHLLARLKVGHTPDNRGWCQHTAHDHHWEHHPCKSLRLALLAEVRQRTDDPTARRRPDRSGPGPEPPMSERS